MLQWIRWYLNGLKVVGDQRGPTPQKIQLSYFWSDFENFTFIGIPMKIHVITFQTDFRYFLWFLSYKGPEGPKMSVLRVCRIFIFYLI